LQVRPRPTSKNLSHFLETHKGRHSQFGVKIGDKDECIIERISEKDNYYDKLNNVMAVFYL
jgi:hypothetical protein